MFPISTFTQTRNKYVKLLHHHYKEEKQIMLATKLSLKQQPGTTDDRESDESLKLALRASELKARENYHGQQQRAKEEHELLLALAESKMEAREGSKKQRNNNMKS